MMSRSNTEQFLYRAAEVPVGFFRFLVAPHGAALRARLISGSERDFHSSPPMMKSISESAAVVWLLT